MVLSPNVVQGFLCSVTRSRALQACSDTHGFVSGYMSGYACFSNLELTPANSEHWIYLLLRLADLSGEIQALATTSIDLGSSTFSAQKAAEPLYMWGFVADDPAPLGFSDGGFSSSLYFEILPDHTRTSALARPLNSGSHVRLLRTCGF